MNVECKYLISDARCRLAESQTDTKLKEFPNLAIKIGAMRTENDQLVWACGVVIKKLNPNLCNGFIKKE